MDISGLLTETNSYQARRPETTTTAAHVRGAGRSTAMSQSTQSQGHELRPHGEHGLRSLSGASANMSSSHAYSSGSASASPTKGAKRVKFELLLPISNSPRRRTPARLPMSVNIWPHDPTASIIATVKNFFGLYEGQCVSFEDKEGNTLIAHHDNFENNMTIYIRTIAGEYDSDDAKGVKLASPKRPKLDPPIQLDMLPPEAPHTHGLAGSAARAYMMRSVSPVPAQSVHGSASRARSRPSGKGRTNSAHGSMTDLAGDHLQQEDSDSASVTSSRRGKGEVLASAEISVENIVEGGRRKRAKFDSSELPLFVPTQMPIAASVSSVSPQRRINSGSMASPYPHNNMQTFAYPVPLPSPSSYNHNDSAYMSGQSVVQAGTGYHGTRHGTRQAPARQSIGGAPILPTPDPTIGGSVISDEDVALQLMRLGEASNFSTHGRTSTSTINEDAFSGKAEAASYSGDSIEASDGEHGLPAHGGHEYSSEEDGEDDRDGSFNGHSEDILPQALNNTHRHKLDHHGKSDKAHKIVGGKPKGPAMPKSKKVAVSGAKGPQSPGSNVDPIRKASNGSLNFQHQFGPDEEDLSSKPRCQRCRKSKKGCDRQRPCGRCKDAGIGIEGCVSEDEGNGRKGRYGRHMGVPVKKASTDSIGSAFVASAPLADVQAPPSITATTMLGASGDNSKKRKR